MANETRIVCYTAEELSAMRERGESRTDWERFDRITDEELEAAIASDPDEANLVVDWSKVRTDFPSKAPMTMRVDSDVLAFFKSGGRGWQTRVNAVLRSYMEHSREQTVTRAGSSGKP